MNMTKSYTETLSEWVKKQETARTKRNIQKIAFLAVRADVKVAIEAGYALKTIWEHMTETGKITCRYETFLKYANLECKTVPAVETPEQKISQSAKIAGFTFNANPKEEDLI